VRAFGTVSPDAGVSGKKASGAPAQAVAISSPTGEWVKGLSQQHFIAARQLELRDEHGSDSVLQRHDGTEATRKRDADANARRNRPSFATRPERASIDRVESDVPSASGPSGKR